MKCPKCQYFSFDNGERCRNCGYDFSLVADAPAPDPDLSIQDGTEALGPLADFSLFTPGGVSDPDAPLVTPGATPRVPLAVRRTAPAVPRPKARRETGRVDSDREPRLALDTAEIAIVPEPAPAPAPVAAQHALSDPMPVLAPAGAR